ncbi:MAG: nonstructural protein [Microviridae sp.]|nr:MAG: nonstructural protein [Microviridae sp.]
MKLKVFSIFDTKLADFAPPFCSLTEASAIRSFTDEINSGQSPLAKHPEDFSLYMLAEYDSSTGTFDTYSPVNLMTAAAVVKPVPTFELLNGKKETVKK